jgi:hypothetical protein
MHYAVQNDYIESNLAMDMAAALATKAHHYSALPFIRFPEYLERLAAYHGRIMIRIVADLSLLTLVRSNELLFASGDEFDFDNSCWRIQCSGQLKLANGELLLTTHLSYPTLVHALNFRHDLLPQMFISAGLS